MSLNVDDLSTFKLHRNKISESLTTEIIGRENDIENICQLIKDNDCIAIVGPSGVGKSRLAIAAIEKYCEANIDVSILCTKSFGDYVTALNDVISDERKYIVFIDDANNYSRLVEMLEYLEYKNIDNIKVVLTVRDYLKQCLDKKEDVKFYEVKALDEKAIREAITKNTIINSVTWLDQIVKISNGNIRVAFIAADNALKDPKGFSSLFNQKDVLNRFYKEELSKIDEFEELITAAGIVAFFRSVYLEQLFYISPILNDVGMSKQSFIRNINILISKEIIDDYNGVVRISDQCFADFLLNYVIVEKEYLKIKKLILVGYKYYKRHIIESLGTILHVYCTEEFVIRLKQEIIEMCDALNDDISLKHELEVAFANIIPEYVMADFKHGVENYSDKKDITWLLQIFSSLALSDYSTIAVEGILRLASKTKTKIVDINKVISSTFSITNKSVNNGYKYIISFLKNIKEKNIFNDICFDLASSYLKFNYDSLEWCSKKELRQYSFNISDSDKNILQLRELSWDYIFHFPIEKVLDIIINFSKYHLVDNCLEILKHDIESINEYLDDKSFKNIIQTILYVKFCDVSVDKNFEFPLSFDDKYVDFFDILLERMIPFEDYVVYKDRYKESVIEYCKNNDANSVLDSTRPILSKYYKSEYQHFVGDLLESSEKYNSKILEASIEANLSPCIVVEKVTKITDFEEFFNDIAAIEDEVVKDEYLYNFYRFISLSGIDNSYGFESWLKSKNDKNTKSSYSRNVLDLRTIANINNIGFAELIKRIYTKGKYNPFIAKCYLSPILLNTESFKELIELNQSLALDVYEFLIDNNAHDYDWKCLEILVDAKRSYIKKVARWFVDEKLDFEDGIPAFLKNEGCYTFLNECMIICLSEYQYFPSFSLGLYLSKNIKNEYIQKWIDKYIESNYRNDMAMNILFSLLSSVEYQYRNNYLIQYYKKGKNTEIIRCALIHKVHSYSDARIYYNSEIKELELLKKRFLDWGNVEVLQFIDIMIEDYRNSIKINDVDSMIDYDKDAFKELRDMDYKTEILPKDAFDLYVKDVGFRKMIDSGYASYANGSYITNKNEPVRFVDVLKDKKIISIKAEEDASYEDYLSSMQTIINKFEHKDRATLNDCLISLIAEIGWSTQEFKDSTYLSKDMFSKIMNHKKKRLEKKTLVQIMIGLQLSKFERDELLDMNGTPLLESDVDDVLFSFILSSKMDIDTADELLRELGKPGF